MLYACIKSDQLANFHNFDVAPTGETGLRVCSNGHAPLTVMPIYGKMRMIKKHILLQNQELFK